MLGKRVVVLAGSRLTRRQIARTLCSAGTSTYFAEGGAEFDELLMDRKPDLVVLDCDNKEPGALAKLFEVTQRHGDIPLVLLSVQATKQALLDLIERVDVGSVNSLIAKHEAEHRAHPILDERELLVTCEKVLRRDIFGIDKYLAAWGILLHHDKITSRMDKLLAFKAFSLFLEQLDCPPRIAASILTVAEELILNAVVHAPVDESGAPKYEHLSLRSEMPLEPHEHVDFRYGSDGQRLMLSVSDNFGRLNKETINRCLCRTSSLDSKPSGAGLGLSLALSKIHQLIFNVQEFVKTEAIAGWYLRVRSTAEFISVGKSLSVFHISQDAGPAVSVGTNMLHFSGRVNKTSDLSEIAQADVVDLRNVRFDDEGTERWVETLALRGGRRPLTIVGCPDSIVRRLTRIDDALRQVQVASLFVPYRCSQCLVDSFQEIELADLATRAERRCADCGATLECITGDDIYQEILRCAAAHPEEERSLRRLTDRDTVAEVPPLTGIGAAKLPQDGEI
jgi:CheY-like chemotaxis protein